MLDKEDDSIESKLPYLNPDAQFWHREPDSINYEEPEEDQATLF